LIDPLTSDKVYTNLTKGAEMTIEQIKEQLASGRYNLKAASRETGVSYEVIRNLANDNYKTCEYESGRILAEYLSK
jgi:hypothetical protein